jgi:hypothetical protein
MANRFTGIPWTFSTCPDSVVCFSAFSTYLDYHISYILMVITYSSR